MTSRTIGRSTLADTVGLSRRTVTRRFADARGQAIDFLLSAKRDTVAAQRFFRKALKQEHTVNPRTFMMDRNAAYPGAAKTVKKHGDMHLLPPALRSDHPRPAAARASPA